MSNAAWWIGGAVIALGAGAVALSSRQGSAVTPPQPRPLPANWMDDANITRRSVLELIDLGYAQDSELNPARTAFLNDAATGAAVTRAAEGMGVTDPGPASATVDDQTRFVRALDDKYRANHHLPDAPDPVLIASVGPAPSLALWSPARRRQARSWA